MSIEIPDLVVVCANRTNTKAIGTGLEMAGLPKDRILNIEATRKHVPEAIYHDITENVPEADRHDPQKKIVTICEVPQTPYLGTGPVQVINYVHFLFKGSMVSAFLFSKGFSAKEYLENLGTTHFKPQNIQVISAVLDETAQAIADLIQRVKSSSIPFEGRTLHDPSVRSSYSFGNKLRIASLLAARKNKTL